MRSNYREMSKTSSTRLLPLYFLEAKIQESFWNQTRFTPWSRQKTKQNKKQKDWKYQESQLLKYVLNKHFNEAGRYSARDDHKQAFEVVFQVIMSIMRKRKLVVQTT